MRVVKIADVPPGRNTGIGRQMWETADATIAAGHAVDVFVGNEVMSDSRALLPRHVRFGQEAARFIQNKLRLGVRYDVIEIHEACAAECVRQRRSDSTFPPVVVKSHGLEHVMWQLRLDIDKRAGRTVPLKTRILTPLLRLKPIRYALTHCDQVIVSNSDDSFFLQNAFHIPESRITLGANGVASFFRQGYENVTRGTEQAQTLLYVGSWVERKGIDLIAQIWELLSKRFPSLQLRLIGTGAVAETVLETFTPGSRKNIVVKAKVNDQELLAEYQGADIFFFPAFLEPWGLVLAEAAATGLPILTTDAGGPKDFFVANKSALLVTPGDSNAMLTGLIALIENPQLRRTLGLQAREAIQKYTWERAAQTHIDAYRRSMSLIHK